MRIEIWRKFIGTDYESTCCTLCGNDFQRGSVFPMAAGDGRNDGEFKELCLVCLDYLNRRRYDEADPAFDNWPSREWPTVEDVEEARRRYPEPMFADREAFEAVVPDKGVEDEYIRASMIWTMEPEVLAGD